MPKPACATLNGVPDIRWMGYNLGANPAYDTPKKQMEYLATTTKTGTDYQQDSTVFGKLYQWGRFPDGYEKRNSDFVNVSTLNNTDYDHTTGQIVSAAVGKFIANTTGSYTDDWQDNHTDFTQDQKNALWGNGVYCNIPTTPNGILAGGDYFQAPVKTDYDPCPSGWRVPTQDEYERFGNYDCNSQKWSSWNDFALIPSESSNYIVPASTPAITWVHVENGKTRPTPYPWADNNNDNGVGYAIYNTDDWNAAGAADYRNGNLFLYETNAPEPLMFLPAAGFRNNNGSLIRVGASGLYWSSTVDGTYGEGAFYSGFGCVWTTAYYTGLKKVYGASVRCVAQ